MAPIPLKCVVSVGSEDPLNPASNLLGVNSTAGKKWLSARDNKTRRSEVILELAKRSRITALEIGNFGSAFVEVLVNNSGCDPDNYITLLPSSMLMSIPDSRAGRGKTTTLKCGRERLSRAAVDKKWNLVKITISQKYNLTEQFGLQHVSLHNDTPTSQTPLRHAPASHTPTRTPLTPVTPSGHSASTPRHRLPSLPGSMASTDHAQKLKNGTPKRMHREELFNEGDEDYEFAGIEKQSRLFKNCVRGQPSTTSSKDETNPILNRIISDKKKYSDKLSTEPPCSYQRTKLLKKDLPKVKGRVDFAQTFKEEEGKSPTMGSVLSTLSAFDDELEIGEESEDKWGWKRGRGRKKSRSLAPKGWLSKRKKIDQLIVECDALVKATSASSGSANTLKENQPLTLDDIWSNTDKKLAHIEEVDSDETRSYDGSEGVEGGGEEDVKLVECPVCGVSLPVYAIEVHASTCGEVPTVRENCMEPIRID